MPAYVKALRDCHGRRWIRDADRAGHWRRGGETVHERQLRNQLGPLAAEIARQHATPPTTEEDLDA
jgi:hypothetical protein